MIFVPYTCLVALVRNAFSFYEHSDIYNFNIFCCCCCCCFLLFRLWMIQRCVLISQIFAPLKCAWLTGVWRDVYTSLLFFGTKKQFRNEFHNSFGFFFFLYFVELHAYEIKWLRYLRWKRIYCQPCQPILTNQKENNDHWMKRRKKTNSNHDNNNNKTTTTDKQSRNEKSLMPLFYFYITMSSPPNQETEWKKENKPNQIILFHMLSVIFMCFYHSFNFFLSSPPTIFDPIQTRWWYNATE